MREARSRQRGRDRDHRRHLQENLDIMRNSGFQGGREDKCAASPRRDSARETAKAQNRPRETPGNKHKRTSQRRHGPEKKTEDAAQKNRKPQEGEGPGPQART